MRKLLIFIIATPLLLGGLYLLVAELFLVHRMFWRIILAASVLTAMGGYPLWMEFVAPRLDAADGRK
jgi:hypothetical protein